MEDNEFYFEESNPKKVKKIIFIGLIILIAIFLILSSMTSRLTLNVKKVVTYEAGDKLSYNIDDYLNNKVIDKKKYNISFSSMITHDDVLDTVGEYEYKIKYKNITRKGIIKVVDTTAPKIKTESIVIGVDEDFYPESAIVSCDDYSLPCQTVLVNNSDEDISKKSGFYTIPVIVKDIVGNKVKTNISVEVRNNYNSVKEKAKDLKYHHIDPNFKNWNGEYLIKFNKGNDDDDLDSLDEYEEIMELVSGDLHRYVDSKYALNRIDKKELIKVYNKYNYIIGIAYYIKLDNGKEFFLTK